MKQFAIFILSVVLLTNGFAQEQKPLPPPPTGVRFERDVIYGKTANVELKLNVARPDDNAKNLPCIVVIHGGGWSGGDRRHHDNMTWEFAKRGYVSATIGYRFAPKYPFPAQIEDVKCAVRYLRAHAEKHGLDANRIGAVGFSAGGHLSMMLGAMDKSDGLEGDGGWAEQSSKVQAVVNYFGPTDFTLDYPDDSRTIVRNFIGGTRAEKPDAYKAASPVTYLNAGDAPILSFQGTKDALVPHSQVYRLTDTMTAAGVAGRTELLVNAGHGWGGAEHARTAKTMFEFFELYLKK